MGAWRGFSYCLELLGAQAWQEFETMFGLLLNHYYLLKQPSKQVPPQLLLHLPLPAQPDEGFEMRNRLTIALLPNKHLNDVVILKCCTKKVFDPLRAASNLAAEASCAR